MPFVIFTGQLQYVVHIRSQLLLKFGMVALLVHRIQIGTLGFMLIHIPEQLLFIVVHLLEYAFGKYCLWLKKKKKKKKDTHVPIWGEYEIKLLLLCWTHVDTGKYDSGVS